VARRAPERALFRVGECLVAAEVAEVLGEDHRLGVEEGFELVFDLGFGV